MATLIYSPGIQVFIKTEKNGTLDVSDDLTGGTLVRRSDGVSTFDFGVQNPRRKYDSVFTPNDIIVVMMKRLTWLRVFTGLLNSVPLRTAWPREVTLSASCSLKRLQYFYWDAYESNTQNMIMAAMNQGRGGPEGEINSVIFAILEKEVGWPRSKIHIGKIPPQWFETAVDIAGGVSRLTEDAQALALQYIGVISPNAIVNGQVLYQTGGWDPVTGQPITSEGMQRLWGGSGTSGVSGITPGTIAKDMLKIGNYGGVALDKEQAANAELIFSIGHQSGFSQRDIWIAIATAMKDSRLRNLASDIAPESATLSDMGLFPGVQSGDQSVTEKVTSVTAVHQFFQRLDRIHNRTKMSPYEISIEASGGVFSAVLVAGHSNNAQDQHLFQRYAKMAKAVASYLTGEVSGVKTKDVQMTVNNQLASRALERGIWLTQQYPNIPYTQQYGGTQVERVLSRIPPPGLDCSSFVQWVVFQTLGALHGCPRTAHEQAAWCLSNGPRLSVQQALNTPGALLFASTNGDTSGVYHVEMSLGNGASTVGAHSANHPLRDQVSVDEARWSGWSFGGLVPSLVYSEIGAANGPSVVASNHSVHSGGLGYYPLTPHDVRTAYRVKGDQYPQKYHTGVDFAATLNQEVKAVTLGRIIVQQQNYTPELGNTVIVQDGNVEQIYGNLDHFGTYSVGDLVATGDILGYAGMSGTTVSASGLTIGLTQPQLHFEVRVAPFSDGSDVDPIDYIKNGVWVDQASASGTNGLVDNSSNLTSDNGWAPLPKVSDMPGYDPNDPISSLFGNQPWIPGPSAGSPQSTLANSLQGGLTLMNDQPLLPYLANLFRSTMRSFCSAPNGDLIAWFPDYYGLWGTAAILRIEPIEVVDFNLTWSDDSFVTHQFVSQGVYSTLDLASGSVSTDIVSDLAQTFTRGVASIDDPAVLQSLFGIKSDDNNSFARWIYRKFGARPNYVQADGLSGPEASLFYAIYMFMLQWAYQYRADIPVTFMPEAYPGMLIQIPKFDFQAYITTVTHAFQFGKNAKFETIINVAAPAHKPRAGKKKYDHTMVGLPLVGGYIKRTGLSYTVDSNASQYTDNSARITTLRKEIELAGGDGF